jgi:hypothetical protein
LTSTQGGRFCGDPASAAAGMTGSQRRMAAGEQSVRNIDEQTRSGRLSAAIFFAGTL